MDENQFYLKYSRQITHLEKFVLFQTFLQERFVFDVKGKYTNEQRLEYVIKPAIEQFQTMSKPITPVFVSLDHFAINYNLYGYPYKFGMSKLDIYVQIWVYRIYYFSWKNFP